MLNPSGPYDSPAHVGERNPPPGAYQLASRRWEVRLSEATLAAWRDLARREGVGLPDLVRVGVELVAELPPGTVRDRLARAEADRAGAIRDASRGPGPGMPSGDIAPLSTRGAR